MASAIHTGLMLSALLHLGMTFSLWVSEDKKILNAILDLYKSVNNNPKKYSAERDFKLLPHKLSLLLKRTDGIHTNKLATSISEIITIIVDRSNDPKLEKAAAEVNRTSELYDNIFQFFLFDTMFDQEIAVMFEDILDLDNNQTLENSRTMSRFFKLFNDNFQYMTNYRNEFRYPSRFYTPFYKYIVRNEWRAFVMKTTVYKLRSIEYNDNHYIKEFRRLRRQLMNKIEMHKARYLEVRTDETSNYKSIGPKQAQYASKLQNIN